MRESLQSSAPRCTQPNASRLVLDDPLVEVSLERVELPYPLSDGLPEDAIDKGFERSGERPEIASGAGVSRG